jgi:hypothetical protein
MLQLFIELLLRILKTMKFYNQLIAMYFTCEMKCIHYENALLHYYNWRHYIWNVETNIITKLHACDIINWSNESI